MSLIADALRAAREEKEGRSGASDKDRRARTLFGSSRHGAGGLRVPRSGRGRGFRGLPFVGALVAGVVLVALGIGLYGSRTATPAEGTAAGDGEGAPVAGVLETTDAVDPDGPIGAPGDGGELALASPPEGGASGRPSGARGSADDGGTAGGSDRSGAPDGDPGEAAGNGAEAGRGGAGAGGDGAGGSDGGGGEDAPGDGRIAAGDGEGVAEEENEADVAGPTSAGGELHVSVETPEPGVREVFELATAAHRAGELEGAAQLYEEALLLDPGNPQIHNNLGTVRRSLGHLRAAREAYRRAVEIAPDYAAAWNNLGIVLDRLGRSGDARAAFEESLRLDPSNVGAKINLATNYHAEAMYQEARDLLREAVREDPRRPEAHYALARALESLGETAEAIRHYDLFLREAGGAFPDLEPRVREHLRSLRAAEAQP